MFVILILKSICMMNFEIVEKSELKPENEQENQTERWRDWKSQIEYVCKNINWTEIVAVFDSLHNFMR